jgi:hypothetical protein
MSATFFTNIKGDFHRSVHDDYDHDDYGSNDERKDNFHNCVTWLDDLGVRFFNNEKRFNR